MKVPSLVLDSVQRPPTVYGLPLGMALTAVGAALLPAVVMWNFLDMFIPGIVVFAVMLAGGFVHVWWARARDPHVEQVKKAWTFWQRGLGWRVWRGWRREYRYLATAKPER